MNGFLDVYSLVFLLVAVAIFWKLRSVLGRRTGHERPPQDPFARREERPAAPAPETNDNVVALPRATRAPAATAEAQAAGVDAVAPAGSALNGALRTIVSADRSFDARHFLDGSRAAYEIIVGAFASGDRDTLKMLLSPDVYEGFSAAIADREKRGEKIETTFVGMDKADIVEAALKNGQAQITVRFVSQLISVTRDRAGAVVDGDPVKVAEVTDVWTFARDVKSRDPNWKLIATEADG
ncbi:Tim44/TimA family putative adaptor protein [Chthonobacter rhizosphaerae]|uniref:Tim44/TimA family putative adaptor protein n=1 Tax=Chthonobacter rhizosphaerae TaxID=2735553 RepID=UPI0015EFD245|nr:Tim44/TimA family putative adaptor protein [Chthonobacter rhizosphaerae]